MFWCEWTVPPIAAIEKNDGRSVPESDSVVRGEREAAALQRASERRAREGETAAGTTMNSGEAASASFASALGGGWLAEKPSFGNVLSAPFRQSLFFFTQTHWFWPSSDKDEIEGAVGDGIDKAGEDRMASGSRKSRLLPFLAAIMQSLTSFFSLSVLPKQIASTSMPQ